MTDSDGCYLPQHITTWSNFISFDLSFWSPKKMIAALSKPPEQVSSLDRLRYLRSLTVAENKANPSLTPWMLGKTPSSTNHLWGNGILSFSHFQCSALSGPHFSWLEEKGKLGQSKSDRTCAEIICMTAIYHLAKSEVWLQCFQKINPTISQREASHLKFPVGLMW